MLITALFTVAKLYNQPRCPSIDEWIKKMWFIYNKEYYPAIKKNKNMSFAGKWMKLEITMFSEINQTQKDKCHMFCLLCGRWT
jgi:hypothetical protein